MDPNFNNDQYDFNPNNYPDQGMNILPQPGVYKVRATSVGRKKDRDGNEVVVDGRWPTSVINRVEILDPQEDSGTFAVFTDVRSKPIRRGKAERPNASAPIDILRSIDVSLMSQLDASQPFDDAATLAEQELKAGSTFTVKLGYRALDIEGAKAALQGVADDDYKAKNAIWTAHTYRTKAFRNGSGYNRAVTTADGRQLTAKLTIDSFVPSSESVDLGPYFKS